MTNRSREYVVDSIRPNEISDYITLVRDPAVRVRTDVSDREIEAAILRHCRAAYEQNREFYGQGIVRSVGKRS